ncbi:RNA methyltransferase [Schaalia sp. 19OD2882]|uniref:TrmH family RNA methyltransferase n=1 Tax=Schaalia sp. 19OD2882 TaxID=2794089 RepID=UPI001C1F0FB5|nr:RNA methyltransferase [Schaalia sp. 19OD2882]QWW18913.1 RNA methyltransferase [Schaalia sp. 19OD2882]
MQTHHERPPVLANPHAERVRKVAGLSGRSARERHGLILVEGPQAVRELLTHRPDTVRDIYMGHRAAALDPDLADLAHSVTRWVHPTTDEVARAMSPDAQGVLAAATFDAVRDTMPEDLPEGVTLALLAQGRDPGNVGTIIRTADAMGAAAVLTVAGTVDVRSPKVVRASAGSVFHVPVIGFRTFDEAAAALRERQAVLLGTSGGDASQDLDALMLSGALESRGWLTRTHAWVFGNEAKGLSRAEMDACDLLVRIDMTGAAESLNVASAAAMCFFASQVVRRSRA